MKVELSRHYQYKHLVLTVIPSILMFLVTSVYSIVDGLFVSNYAGTTPFAAVSLIWPGIMLIGSLGIMIGTGGAALVAKTKGEGNLQRANEIFTMLIRLAVIGGILLSILMFTFMRPLSQVLGAEGQMLSDCVTYGRILSVSFTPFLLHLMFNSFFMAAERPALGTKLSVVCGVTNMILDFLFIAIFHWGIAGAAIATAIGQSIGGLYPLYYFASQRNKSSLHIVPTRFDWKSIRQSCLNGSSEYVGNIALSIVSICYNVQLIHYIGEDGVATYGILMYVAYIYAAVFIGYNVGVSPIISYHYGAGNRQELHSLLVKSLVILSVGGTALTLMAELLSRQTSAIFVGYDPELLDLTTRAFRIYMVSFMICGINLFVSAFFTALNNGVVSALAAFTRTLIFEVGAVFLLPHIIGIDGIWWSVDLADLLALIMSIILLAHFRRQYGY